MTAFLTHPLCVDTSITGLIKFKANPSNLPGMTLSLIKFEFNLNLNSKNNILT